MRPSSVNVSPSPRRARIYPVEQRESIASGRIARVVRDYFNRQKAAREQRVSSARSRSNAGNSMEEFMVDVTNHIDMGMYDDL